MASFPAGNSVPLKTVVLAAGPFNVAMEHENLVVIAIPKESVPTFAWWIIREYCLDRCRKTCFHSILLVLFSSCTTLLIISSNPVFFGISQG